MNEQEKDELEALCIDALRECFIRAWSDARTERAKRAFRENLSPWAKELPSFQDLDDAS